MKKGDSKTPKEKRPPIDSGGIGFNEVLKRLANTNPNEVADLEKAEKEKSTNPQKKRPIM